MKRKIDDTIASSGLLLHSLITASRDADIDAARGQPALDHFIDSLNAVNRARAAAALGHRELCKLADEDRLRETCFGDLVDSPMPSGKIADVIVDLPAPALAEAR